MYTIVAANNVSNIFPSLFFRCGIGTLSRNRSRAGSVDESQMRTICRSVTPTGSTKANDIHEQVAFTLPRNFETNKTQLSGGLKINDATKKGDQDRIYNGFRQSNHSGMSIDHINSF